MEKYQYIAFITNENYLKGLFVLSSSLKRNCKVDLSIVVPETVSDEFISEVKKYSLNSNVIKMPLINVEEYGWEKSGNRNYWKETFFKLNVARLTQFDKVVMLDCDLLILKNIDCLFDMPNFSATNSGHILFEDWFNLNSGVFVLEPSDKLFKDLTELIPQVIDYSVSNDVSVGDQDVFITYLKDWKDKPELNFSEKFNCYYRALYKFANTLPNKIDDVCVVHYFGRTKIWNMTFKAKMINALIDLKNRNHDIKKAVALYNKELVKLKDL